MHPYTRQDKKRWKHINTSTPSRDTRVFRPAFPFLPELVFYFHLDWRADDPNAPALGEEEILAAKALAVEQEKAMAKAVDLAIPRVCMVKAHSGKVAATRQVGEGGQVLTLGAADR